MTTGTILFITGIAGAVICAVLFIKAIRDFKSKKAEALEKIMKSL